MQVQSVGAWRPLSDLIDAIVSQVNVSEVADVARVFPAAPAPAVIFDDVPASDAGP